jgi:transmembrane sensor
MREDFNRLLDAYLNGEATEAELHELFDFIRDQPAAARRELVGTSRRAFEALTRDPRLNLTVDPDLGTRMLGRLMADIHAAPVVELRRPWPWRRLAVAAVLTGLLGTGAFWWSNSRTKRLKDRTDANVTHDLAPGGNKAILTLANGATIVLDSALNGALAQQGSSSVWKVAGGEVAYKNTKQPGPPGFNSVATPRGGQYTVILPDGTKVWLNAASSIRFPTAFTGSKREVEITGEAYVEVMRDPRHPFQVKAGSQVIEDLGTHFDVNAYRDEPALKTTLLEGSVKVGSVILSHPGQQAGISKEGKAFVSNDVNTGEVVSWTNGYFEFTDADIKTVMRQLGRWYGVTIEYANRQDTALFTGQFGRNLTAAKAFQILSATGYHFSIRGDTILVE